MYPKDYIDGLYYKTKKVTYVAEDWIPLYLNKALLQNPNNAEALLKANEYCLYINPTHYYYLLFCLIPACSKYSLKPVPKKSDKEDEDELITKIREYLGWSKKELDRNYKQLEQSILKDREYWMKEMGVDNVRMSKRKS